MKNNIPSGARRVLKLAIPDSKVRGNLNYQVKTWISCSGPEWTVSRLKAIRTGLYQLRAGNPEKAKLIWQKESIAYNHTTLLPKGSFGVIGSRFLRASKPSVIRRLDAVLRIYTCIYSQTLTQKQLTKAKTAINGQALNPDFMDCLPKEFKVKFLDRVDLLARRVHHSRIKSPYQGDGFVNIDLGCMSPTSATHAETTLLADNVLKVDGFNDFPWAKHVKSLWTSVYLPEELKLRNPAEKLRKLIEESGANSDICGHISFLQEGGCKARVVAVPNIWIQCLMKPLEDYLDKIVHTLSPSCSHDQNKGAYFLKEKLLHGDKLYCYDLSSATDRFPYLLQGLVLYGLGLHDYADAIDHIAHGNWRAEYTLKGVEHKELWSYAVGQPMGMYSSFKLFHLTHILLLMAICDMHNVEPFDSFRVLGDDVIISKRCVAESYRDIMEILGVELSETKTLISNSVAEFAGFVAYTTNRSVCVHRPFKYSGKSGFGAAIPLLFAFGRRTRTLSPWFSKVYTEFTYTISKRNPDLSPLLSLKDDDGHRAGGLNSHLLGSMSNRLSYYSNLQVSSELLECFEEQQIILLGQKEIVVDGYASASGNVDSSPGRTLEAFKENEYRSRLARRPFYQLSSDPLMKEQSKLSGTVEA